jgi:hypothetical protein
MGRHLYILQAKTTGFVKIGRSNDPEKRLLQLQTGCATPLKLILVAKERGNHEKELHRQLARYQTVGEWFKEECLGSIPVEIWEQTLEWYQENPDWWKQK